MPAKVDEVELQVETLLFASGKPLSVHEMTEALRLPDHRLVQRAVKKLQRAFGSRRTALEVARVGERFALQVREEFLAVAHAVAPTELAPRTLKTLTLIAYHQPMLQSLLARMQGESAYEEVQRLRSIGLIHAEPKGATLELTTSHAFAEYFGISATRPEEIRLLLENKLGVASVGTERLPNSVPVRPPTSATNPAEETVAPAAGAG